MNPKIDSSATTETANFPVIDLSNPSRAVADQILATAIKHEFLYIDTKGTGLTKDNVDRMFEVSRNFFDLPGDQKRKCLTPDSTIRWIPFKSRRADPENHEQGEPREALIFPEFDSDGNQQQTIPEALKGCLDEIFRFQDTCRELCMKILTVIEMALESEEPEFFASRHKRPTMTAFAFNKYPAVADDMDFNLETGIRIGAHTDYGSLTLLFQRAGQPGLEVRNPEGVWVPVSVFPVDFQGDLPPILVNFGDILHYWTNGLLRSTIHRVVFPKERRGRGEDRYSIAYFCCPSVNAKLLPLPSKMVRSMKPIEDGEQVGYGGGASKIRAESAEEHVRNRRMTLDL